MAVLPCRRGILAVLSAFLVIFIMHSAKWAAADPAVLQRPWVEDQVIMRPLAQTPHLVEKDYSLATVSRSLKSAATQALKTEGVSFRQVSALPHLGLAVAKLSKGQTNVASRLAQGGQVEWVEHPRMRYKRAQPSDTLFPYQWSLHNTGDAAVAADLNQRFSGNLSLSSGADMGAVSAWDRAKGNPNDVVVVMDSGIHSRHVDLASSLWVNPGEVPNNGLDDDQNGYVDDYHGFDIYNWDGDPNDGDGHGTFCAGIIAAAENGQGVVGLAPQVKVMAVRVSDDNGNMSDLDILWGIEYILEMAWRGVPIRAVNMSFGGPGYTRAQDNAVAALADFGILAVVAAGNSGQNLDFQPADYPTDLPQPNIITVGISDGQDLPVGWSAWGEYNVDVFAPGYLIVSTAAPAYYTDHDFIEGDFHWTAASGTSFSAPQMVAAAALAWDLYPNADWRQIKALLLQSGKSLASLSGLARTGARLDAAALTTNALPGGPMLFRLGDILPVPGQTTTVFGYGLGDTPGSVRVNGTNLTVLGWENNQVRVRLPEAATLDKSQVTMTLTTASGGQATMPFLLATAGDSQSIEMDKGGFDQMWPLYQKQVLLGDRVWGLVDMGYDALGNIAHGWAYFEISSSRLVYQGSLPQGIDQPEDMVLVNHGGTLYCLGGSSQNLIYTFNPVNGAWTQVGKMPPAQNLVEPLVASDGGYIYVAGGALFSADGNSSTYAYEVYRWEPRGNLWTQIATLPLAAERGKAFAASGRLILVGGYTLAGSDWTQGRNCLTLNLVTGEWHTSLLPFGSLDGGLAVHGDWLYFYGASSYYGSASPFVARARLVSGIPQSWEALPRRMGFSDLYGTYSWVWADSQGMGIVGGDLSRFPSSYSYPQVLRFDLPWE